MLDKLVYALATDARLSPEEIMDVLWLSATRPLSAGTPLSGDVHEPSGVIAAENETGQGAPDEHAGKTGADADAAPGDEVPLRLDAGLYDGGERVPAAELGFGAPPPIHDPLGLAQALRGLKAVRAPGPRAEVDIDATVDATAEARRLTIVATRPLQRVLDLAIVVDGAPAMRIWDETFDQFERVLLQTGAFRTVSRWGLATGAGGETQLVDRRNVRLPARRLVNPAGRRVVLIATDASAANWYTGSLWAGIALWSKSMPTAIVQLLPPHYWPSTAIGEPYMTVRSATPASPNTRYARRLHWWATDPGGDPVPVLTLTAAAFTAWTRAVVTGTDWVDAITAVPPDPEHVPPLQEADDPVTVVNDFLVLASDGAERLARALSGAATLSMPLISLLQEELALGTGVTELAEILASGLLVDAGGERRSSASGASAEDQPLLRFPSGVREILQRGATAFDEWATYNAVSRYLAERGRAVGSLRTLVPDPAGSAELNLATDPFGALERSLAVRLGLRPAESAESDSPLHPDPVESDAPAQPAPEPVPEALSPHLRQAVNAVAVSPDGTWLASGGADGVVRIWDSVTGQLRGAFTGHTDAVNAVAVSPDGRRLVSGGADGTVRIWDQATGQQLGRARTFNDVVNAVAVSPDGRWVISGDSGGNIRIADVAVAGQLRIFETGTGAVNALVMSPDGTWLASGSADGAVQVWDLTNDLLGALTRTSVVRALAVWPDAAQLAAAYADGAVRIAPTPRLPVDRMSGLEGNFGAVHALAVSPDGAWLATGVADGTVRIWDSGRKQPLNALLGHSGPVYAVAVSPDGRRLVSGGADGTVRIWDVSTGGGLAAISHSGEAELADNEAESVAEADEDVSAFDQTADSASRVEITVGPPGAIDGQILVTLEDFSTRERTSALTSFDIADLRQLSSRLTVDVPVGQVSKDSEVEFRRFGQTLFRALLGGGEILECYQDSVANAARRKERLRIELEIAVPELAALPWEAMYDSATRGYVCRQHSLVRRLPVAPSAPPLAVRPPLRILGIISSPRDLPPLDAERERSLILRALAGPIGEGRIEITWTAAATWTDLHEELLAGAWHVIHFIGHGGLDTNTGEPFLVLAREDGSSSQTSAGRFSDLLREAHPAPRLVVLNTNRSAPAAPVLLRAGVSAVVGMQLDTSDSAAIAFSSGFYAALGHGRPVDEAVSAGRVGILGLSDQTLEWASPVLYLDGDPYLLEPKRG